jgi:iron complex outermembrane receptor protein
VVTAQKRAESLQDVPLAVSTLSGEDLSNFGVSGTQALQMTTPGLVFSNTGASAQPYLRGVGTRLALNGLESSIATYVDDRYISRPAAAMFEFADVERVEVLKGPQGTLYGRNATGGAIRVITKDVADELEGRVKASAGNFGAYGLSGTVSVPITDNLGARFTALTKQRDGYADNLSPLGASELDDQDYQAYRAKFRWDTTDNVTAHLSLDYAERNDTAGNDIVDLSPPGLNVGIALGGISGKDIDEVATAIKDNDESEEFSAQLRFDVAFDQVDFASITTYADLEQFRVTDADGTSTQTLDVPAIYEEAQDFSQEFQLVSNSDGSWDWILGAYYFNSDVDYDLTLDVGLPIHLSQGFQNVETTAWAVYGQSTWHIDEAWALTLGARWNSEKKEVETLASTNAPVTFTPGLPFEDNETWDEFTPKVTLEYNLEEAMVYLTYARGFKSGGYNYPAAGSAALDPEILDMVELGLKGDFLDSSLRVNASLYYYDYADLQVTRAASGGGGLVTTENAADAQILGFDADITWLATDHLTVTAGLNLLDTEYKDYDANAKVFNAVLTGDPSVPGMSDVEFDASGRSMLRAPDWSGFVSAEYAFEMGDASVPVVVTYSYKDEYEFDFVADPLSERLVQDSYGLLSARISYVTPAEDWIVAVWGNNLTDEEYFDDIVGNSRGIRGSWGLPRTYGVDLTFNF